MFQWIIKPLLRPVIRSILREEIMSEMDRLDATRKDINALQKVTTALQDSIKDIAGSHAGYSREMYLIRTETESTINKMLDDALIRIGAYEDASIALINRWEKKQ